MSSEAAAVLMCAGLTVYSALDTHVTSPGLKVAIVGVWGLGHLAIQFAHAFGCEVTAISSSPTKEENARGFGAQAFLDATDETSLRKSVFSNDLPICTTYASILWGLSLQS